MEFLKSSYLRETERRSPPASTAIISGDTTIFGKVSSCVASWLKQDRRNY